MLNGCSRSKVTSFPLENEAILQHIVQELILNVYSANQLENPGKIYDCFARSFAGPLLERQFFEHLKGKKNREETNTVIGDMHLGFTQFKRISADNETRLVEVGWEARGEIWHMLHRHTRHNQYLAQFVLTQIQREWRITAFNVEMELRVD